MLSLLALTLDQFSNILLLVAAVLGAFTYVDWRRTQAQNEKEARERDRIAKFSKSKKRKGP